MGRSWAMVYCCFLQIECVYEIHELSSTKLAQNFAIGIIRTKAYFRVFPQRLSPSKILNYLHNIVSTNYLIFPTKLNLHFSYLLALFYRRVAPLLLRRCRLEKSSRRSICLAQNLIQCLVFGVTV